MATAPLPPLTDLLDHGPDGAEAFERLIHELLLAYAARKGFHYRVWRDSEGKPTGEGFAQDGVPDLDGPVAFHIQWVWRNIHQEPTSPLLLERFRWAAKTGKLAHWVLITPWDLSRAERVWLLDLQQGRGPSVEHWGKSAIERLLRDFPALLARCYPQEVMTREARLPRIDRARFVEQTAAYRDRVVSLFRTLRVMGLPPETTCVRETRTELPLDALFVPPTLNKVKDWWVTTTLAEALRSGGCKVVLGAAGMGKTTLLSFLALLYAGGASLPNVVVSRSQIPIFLSLRELARDDRPWSVLSMVEHLVTTVSARYELPKAFFEAKLRAGEAVVLFDGLDEVGSGAQRYRVSEAILAFAGQHPTCPVWVTSGSHGYALEAGDVERYLLCGFSRAQINTFIDRWYALQMPEDPEERDKQATSLRDAIREASVLVGAWHTPPRAQSPMWLPLILTLTAVIHHGLGELPRDRATCSKRCVEMLLSSARSAGSDERLGLDARAQMDYLAHFAFDVREEVFSRSEALRILIRRHLELAEREGRSLTFGVAREEMSKLLDHHREETRLVVERGRNELSFLHPWLQDYLAAWVVTCDADTLDWPDLFDAYWRDPLWAEVLPLRLHVILREPGGEEEIDRIMDRLVGSLDRIRSVQGWFALARVLRDWLKIDEQIPLPLVKKLLAVKVESAFVHEQDLGTLWCDELSLFGPRAGAVLREVLVERLPGAGQEEREALEALLAIIDGHWGGAPGVTAGRDPVFF